MTINKLDTDGNWMVGTSHLYIPSAGIKVQHTNVAGADSGRAEDGVMYIDWVRRDVVKVYLAWATMTESELNYTLGLLQGKEFVFKYIDHGSVRTINAYCAESNYELVSTNYLGTGECLYADVSINVIEM